jgi:uncharacterized protein with NAD-binding domain and iron-sulfur cluster
MQSSNADQSGDMLIPVVVIGAGLAGLTAAVHLADRGILPIVLESDTLWAGGRLSGGEQDRFEYNGREWAFYPDHGVHAVWGGYDNLRSTLNRFTDTTLVTSGGEEWINRWGRQVRMIEAGNAVRSRWIPAPFHYLQLLFNPIIWRNITPLDFLSLPGFLFSILLTIGVDPIKEQISLDQLTIKEFFRGWTPNLKATFKGLGVNLLAAPEETISLTAFIAALRFYTILRRDAWKMQYFPSNSHHSLIEPLCTSLQKRGGKVIKGATVKKIDKQNNSWKISFEDSSKLGRRSIWAKYVILAMNAPATKRLLSDSPATQEIADDLRFPSAIRSAVARIWFDRAPREGTTGGLLTGDFRIDNFFWLHRMYADFIEWNTETGGSAVEVHIYGSESLLDQSDRNLLIIAVDEIQRAFPEVKGAFIHGVVRRNSRTHTVFRVPTKDSLHVTTPWENIFACGDWIGYPTPSFWMERATVTGIAAANQILGANKCTQFPITPPKRAEPLALFLSIFVRGIRILFKPIFVLLRTLRKQI